LALRPVISEVVLMPWLLAGCIGFFFALLTSGLYPGRGIFGPERIRLRAVAALVGFTPPGIACELWTGGWLQAIPQSLAFGLSLFLVSAFFETVAISLLVARKLWQVDVMIVGDPAGSRNATTDLTLFPELGLRPVSQSAGADAQATGLTLQQEEDGLLREYLVDAASPLPAMHPVERLPRNATRQARFFQMLLKRALDFSAALLLLIIASPILAATALLILFHDGRPIFFRQVRGGKDGRDVLVWKFRSMYKDAPARLENVLASDPALREEWSRFFKLRNDPRILPVIGNFIRRTSIDELPQLWNVLKGDMSLVGPRPFPHNHLAAFSKEFQAVRHKVLPGITGLWQVTLRSDGDLEMQERLDASYIRGWSIWLDLYILFRTPIVLLSSRGAR
jgi:lipopolysaccharide/colanic/teichoic acid biosynthesis glycosyltransferase